MIDTREALDRIGRRVRAPEPAFERLVRRRDRRRRNQRLGTAITAIIVTIGSLVGLAYAFRTVPRPAGEPTSNGIFSSVSGRILFGANPNGKVLVRDATIPGVYTNIWALDPSAGSARPTIEFMAPDGDMLGEPLAWSADGSRLLIFHPVQSSDDWAGDLYVLNSDGSETRVARSVGSLPGGSFSPDGSKVVYSNGSAIYVVSAEGGTPRLVRAPERRVFPRSRNPRRTRLTSPAFSPDGSKIVYVDGLTDWGNTIRVMNADGSHVRIIVHTRSMPPADGCNWLGRVLWSPDGSRLAYTCRGAIWVVGADGSGLTRVLRNAAYPQWSPDGTRIAFQRPAFLDGNVPMVEIADRRGGSGRLIGPGTTGAWNPLPLPPADQMRAAAPTTSGRFPSAAGIAVVTLVSLIVLVGAARTRIGHRGSDRTT